MYDTGILLHIHVWKNAWNKITCLGGFEWESVCPEPFHGTECHLTFLAEVLPCIDWTPHLTYVK